MSWNNAIPASIVCDILDQIRKEPKQLHFDEELFPPLYTIKEEYLTSCNEAFTWISPTGHGPSGTVASAVDHPAFAALRKHLAVRGYIEMQTNWVNGDRVIKPFYLNEVYFDVGEKFVSGSAMCSHLKFKRKYGNEFRT
jgi:hypothetical protein